MSLAAAENAAETRARWTAIAMILLAQQLITAMDTVAKLLTQDFTIWQVAWARFVFHLLPLVPLLLLQHKPGLLWRVARAPLQILRSVFMVGATCLFFGALARIPLADAVALVFVAPLVITALAPLVLREEVGFRRWIAVGCGFMGVLILVRPGFQTVELGTLLAVACGCTFAGYALATRHLSFSAPPLVTLAMSAVVGSLVLSLLLIVESDLWRTPDAGELAMMATLGLVACVAHGFLIMAYERAPASLLAPFSYTEIAGAALLGYLVFGDFPDAWAWVGIAVIVSAGVYNAWLGARR
ncbi:MAG: DMT family transporter [Rhodospirillales bacterium]